MKMLRFFPATIALATTLALASCNANDDAQPSGPHPIQFTAGIGQPVVANPDTRAAGTMWNDGDAIGVFMVDHGTTTIAENAANKKFTIGSAGSVFNPILGSEIYYPMSNSAVDFIAYYPYQTSATLDAPLAVSTTDQSAQSTFDMLWAQADNTGADNTATGYTKDADADTPIPLVFAHRLAKLTMNCTAEANTGYTSLDDAIVTIHGMNTATTFSVKDGSLGTPSTVADITPRRATTPTTGALATFDAVIIPANYGANQLTVTFTIGSETYTWDVNPVEFESGKEYIYEVILTRTGVQATGTITKWETVTQGPVYAD